MEMNTCKAIVTGGASGLGEACVRNIVNHGGNAAIFDMQKEKGEALSRELKNNVSFIQTDISNEKSVNTAVEKAYDRLEGLNVVLNCAGIGGPCKVWSDSKGPMPMEFVNQRININLVGTICVIVNAVKKIIKNVPNEEGERGVIVNTSSGAAFQGQIGQAAYSASKAGVIGLSLPMARELGKHGIRVMAIAPGIFNTPMFSRVPPKVYEKLNNSVPFPKRMGKSSEFAQLAQHIIENPYLNGSVIAIDGALRMS